MSSFLDPVLSLFIIVAMLSVVGSCQPILPQNGTENDTFPLSSLPVKELQEMSIIVPETSPNRPNHMVVSHIKSVFYIISTNQKRPNVEEPRERVPRMDLWTLLWYIVTCLAFVTIFLLVSFTECLCSKRRLLLNQSTPATPSVPRRGSNDQPPPPYHLFGPPSYDSLFHDKAKIQVFTVPLPNS